MMDAYYDYFIIGGGIAGVTAAETIRSRDADGSIAILSDEVHPLYSRVLLPAYLKGRIARDRIFLRIVDDYAAKKIDFYPDTEVVAVDVSGHIVKTADNRIFHFGKLLIASGGKVKRWEHDEAASPHSYRLQTIDDADRLVRDMSGIRVPLVIGASFIALELIEIFLHHKIIPQVMSEASGFFGAFADTEGSGILEQNFKRLGVSCVFDQKIVGCHKSGEEYAITMVGGDTLRTDAFAVGIGIERSRDFLSGSGITLGRRGVKVNEYLESDMIGIYSAGDIAEYYDVVSDEYRTAGNWTNAILQGTRAGLNMTGERLAFTHIPSYGITNCGMQIVMIGECGGEGMSAITRSGGSGVEYERLFTRRGIIVGAFLINRFQDRTLVTDLISRRVDVSAYEYQLHDMAFDINVIIKIK
ncbi:MAG: NAD(P)/FAD-dependent oxidoreductase [Candidatus Sungiibacteriota bacterium]